MPVPHQFPPLSPVLLHGWLWLTALSGFSAILSALAGQGVPRPVAGILIMSLAMAKARIILARYLGLRAAPAWLRGFTTVIWLWALIALGFYLAPLAAG